MRHRTKVRLISGAVLAVTMGIVACQDNPLDVKNQANPDVSKVYGSPKDVETIVSKLFQQLWNAQQANTGIGVQTMVMSFESHSALANFALGARAAIPRGLISNALGNANQTENFNDFDGLQRNARSASNAIAAIYKFNAAGNTIGSPARDVRAKAFGYFELGYALGNVALIYDSAAIITPATPVDEIPPLSAAKDVMASALLMLDSALAYSNSADIANGANGFPIPGGWVSGSDMPVATFQKVVRSYKARFRANIARTPAERNAVNWDAVIADTQNGITTDFIVNADATLGWALGWRNQLAVDATWSQMTPMILGMADTTGAYDAWLATALDKRTPFLLRTPDKRFPSGETRAIQSSIQGSSRAGTPAGSILYFINRPQGDDKIAEPWGTWYYDNWRFWGPRAAGGNGPVTAFTRAENDLLQAEGQYRKGNYAAAAALVDKTRVPAGLPPLSGVITNATQQVPGGNACVPRVPQPPSYTTTACGTLLEALKWEKRVETSFTGYAQWWLDSRGWGDLVEGTALEWAVPWQELFARLGPTYTNTLRAAKGNYGL
jgi:hypothetical protein